MSRPIDINDFEDALDRHGADSSLWPETVRIRATALLESSARARDLLAEAKRLQQALSDALPTVPAPPGLKTRILANLPRRDPWLEWLTMKRWRLVALACVPLALGFAVGLNVVEDTASWEDRVLVAFSETEFAEFELPGDE